MSSPRVSAFPSKPAANINPEPISAADAAKPAGTARMPRLNSTPPQGVSAAAEVRTTPPVHQTQNQPPEPQARARQSGLFRMGISLFVVGGSFSLVAELFALSTGPTGVPGPGITAAAAGALMMLVSSLRRK